MCNNIVIDIPNFYIRFHFIFTVTLEAKTLECDESTKDMSTYLKYLDLPLNL